jgi:hypothetical protein
MRFQSTVYAVRVESFYASTMKTPQVIIWEHDDYRTALDRYDEMCKDAGRVIAICTEYASKQGSYRKISLVDVQDKVVVHQMIAQSLSNHVASDEWMTECDSVKEDRILTPVS